MSSSPLWLDIGCGKAKRPGSIGFDRAPLPGVDIVGDLEQLPWIQFATSSFDHIYASHVLEHIHELIPVMEELHRILKPGGILEIWVPFYRHANAYQDPTHCRFFTEHTFDYFTPESPFNYYSTARFHILHQAFGGFPDWHIHKHVEGARLRDALNATIPLFWKVLREPRELHFILQCVKDGMVRP